MSLVVGSPLNSTMDGVTILGTPFMRTFFTAFNFTDNTVSIANSAGEPNYIPRPPTPAPAESSSSLGLILGISIGGLIIIAVIIICICRNKAAKTPMRRNSSINNEDTMTEETNGDKEDGLAQPLNISESKSMVSASDNNDV